MPDEQQEAKKGPSAIYIWFHNKLTDISNATLGHIFPNLMMSKLTRGGTQQETIGYQQYQDLIQKNNGFVQHLEQFIESRWVIIEEKLFGPEKFEFEEEPKSNVFSDLFRKLEYFRDIENTKNEGQIFTTSGTIDVEKIEVDLDIEEIKKSAEKMKKELEEKKKPLDEKDGRLLKQIEYLLATKKEDLDKMRGVPHIVIGNEIVTFIDGREEKIVAMGKKIAEIIGQFAVLSAGINVYAATAKVSAEARAEVGEMLSAVIKALEEVNGKEIAHGNKVGQIHSTLEGLNKYIIDPQGDLEKFRPLKARIRFAHTYKIIKPYRIVETNVGGSKVRKVEKFEDEHRNFKRADEVAHGLDENGKPLEVDEDGNVLLDKWWVEISENPWQIRTILGKNGGKEVLRNKVVNGVKKEKRPYTYTYRSGYVRKVPKEYVGDLDPVDKMSFISNEFDAYIDDFRDGRFHWHSKSSMDYIIAANPIVEDVIKEKESVIPDKPINFDVNTEDPKVRIKFRPIYYTAANTGNKTKHGEVNPRGGLGDKNLENVIPEDERKVSRRYELEVEVNAPGITKDRVVGQDENGNPIVKHFLEHQVRKPTHLNPAFDRAALGSARPHTFIHWGRMYYYETTEGINRWSENPFPHITTRGFGKYLINLILKKSFSFNDARDALRHGVWDFGVRHYGEPFIKDPLGPAEGPEGVLSHAREVARKKGWL